MAQELFDAEILDDGLETFQEILKKYEVSDEEVLKSMEQGAKEMCMDLRKLPRPRSNIRKAGYTHLLETFTYKKNKKEIEVGWGKYYGPMVENGTVRASASPHVKPYFKANQNKIYNSIINKLWK